MVIYHTLQYLLAGEISSRITIPFIYLFIIMEN